MRYFLIDRITHLEYHKRLTAIKCAAMSEDVFADHFLGNPVMPGALQIESMAQAGTVLLEVSSEFRNKALLVMVHSAKFRELVRPGDKMRIEMTVISRDENMAQLDGSIHVDDILVTSGRLSFSLHPIEDFYVPESRSLTDALYRSIFRGAVVEGGPNPGA